MHAAEVEREAMELPPEERISLARRLLASVEPTELGIDEAWENEILERIAKFDTKEAKVVPAAEVFERLRQIALANPDRNLIPTANTLFEGRI